MDKYKRVIKMSRKTICANLKKFFELESHFAMFFSAIKLMLNSERKAIQVELIGGMMKKTIFDGLVLTVVIGDAD
jgi:hypothetical protein